MPNLPGLEPDHFVPQFRSYNLPCRLEQQRWCKRQPDFGSWLLGNIRLAGHHTCFSPFNSVLLLLLNNSGTACDISWHSSSTVSKDRWSFWASFDGLYDDGHRKCHRLCCYSRLWQINETLCLPYTAGY